MSGRYPITAMQQEKKKILVGMSGGVDSSVSAALLVAQGHEVIGGYMKNWSDSKDTFGVCSWKSERRDAQRVAAQLGIALQTFDFEQEYRKDVLEYLYEEYARGRTPNPDVLCNQYIKFGYFLAAADTLGCEYVATGHYAGNRVDEAGAMAHLLRAVDENKDQTYFLHRLSQSQLRRAIFPLTDYTKQEVRALAREFNLPTAEKKESMGICFVGKVPMKEFLSQYITFAPGEVVHEDGRVIGTHEGLPFCTIGQRHGFTQPGGTTPLYVAQKDHTNNCLIVAPRESALLLRKEVMLEDIHWITGSEPRLPFTCLSRLRHRQPLVSTTIERRGDVLFAVFDEPQWAPAAGQFCVFYNEKECLGGGVIG